MSPTAFAVAAPTTRWGPSKLKSRVSEFTALHQASMLGLAVPSSYVEDRVDRAANTSTPGTSESGHVWTAQRGVWGRIGNALYNVSNLADALCTTDGGIADGDYRCRLAFTAAAGAPAGTVFRGIDDENYLALVIDETSGVRLRKCVAGAYTTLATQAVTVTNGVTYRLWAQFDGGAIKLYLNNTLQVTHTLVGGDEVTFASGTLIGMLGNGSAGTTQRWDDIRVDPVGCSAVVALGTDLIGSTDVSQATGAKKPTLLWDGECWVFRFDGTASLLVGSSSISSALKGYVAIGIKRFRTSPGTSQSLFASCDEAVSTRLFAIKVVNSRIELRVRDGTDDRIKFDTTALVTNTSYIVEVWAGSSAYGGRVNGVTQTKVVVSGTDSGRWIGNVSARDNVTIGGSKRSDGEVELFGGDITFLILAEDVPRTQEMDRTHSFVRFRHHGLRITTPIASGELVYYDAILAAAGLTTSETRELTEVADFSGHGRGARWITGDKPLVFHDGTRWCMRLNSVTLSSLVQSLQSAIQQPLTIIMTVRIRADSLEEQRVLDGRVNGTRIRFSRQPGALGNVVLSAGTSPSAALVDDLQAHVWTFFVNGAASDMRRDHGLNAGMMDVSTDSMGAVTLGSNAAGDDLHAALDLCRLQVFSGIKTLAQALTLAEAVETDYAIPLYENAAAEVHAIAVVGGADGSCIFQDGGRTHVVSLSSPTGVYLFQQGADIYTWTRWTVAEGIFSELQGVYCGDFDGDAKVEIFALDQVSGIIHIFKQPGATPFVGTWDHAEILTGRPGLQAALVYDIDSDGDPELVYAWEGSAPTEGGYHWLDFDGADVLEPGDWTDHLMAQWEGAWSLAHANGDSTRYLLDLGGDGAHDLVVSSRWSRNKNLPAGGLGWLERPAIVTDPWTLTKITATGELVGPDWTRVDVGDFTGDGTRKDIVAMLDDGTVSVFRHSTGYTQSIIASPGNLWNVWTDPRPSGRDRILFVSKAELTPSVMGGLYLLTYTAGAWVPQLIHAIGRDHPWDNRNWLAELVTGDGVPRYITGAGDMNQVLHLRLLV